MKSIKKKKPVYELHIMHRMLLMSLLSLWLLVAAATARCVEQNEKCDSAQYESRYKDGISSPKYWDGKNEDESEVDESEVDESEVDESEVDESEVDESEVDESEVAESEVAESEVAESEVAESEVDESEVDESDGDGDEFDGENHATKCECGLINTGLIIGGIEFKPKQKNPWQIGRYDPHPRINKIISGGPVNNNLYILGGMKVLPNRKYPWQIGLHDPHPTINKIICGGTIINNHWILTAAHCIIDIKTCKMKYNSSSSLQVSVGEHHQFVTSGDTNNANKYNITTYVKHPNFDCTTLDYDFFLLKLTESIPFNDVIMPICLPKDDSNNYIGHFGNVAGWGRVSPVSTGSYDLREAEVKIKSNSYCNISAIKICAAGEAGMNACEGDSGGPLFVVENHKHVQVGVVSYGYGKCEKTTFPVPGIYARVSKVLPWITTTTANGRKCD